MSDKHWRNSTPAGASAGDGAADGRGRQEDQVHALPEQFHDARPRGGDKKWRGRLLQPQNHQPLSTQVEGPLQTGAQG